jgi:ABC-2 type transport system ATP-binding protein
MSYCIHISGLSYSYTHQQNVLSNIDLHVPEGSIYGFLGANGAGKTTTLKLLLGLLKNQRGDIRVFGKEFSSNRNEILRQTGSLIETPSLYAQLTAAENLEVFRKIYGSPRRRINDVLHLVGLSSTGKKKAGAFSLGMKQRLSIAVALLHQPSLLILDEPTNGLDPNGIIEMRNLLRQLNADHKITILVSSHLLSEIEKLVTHVGIIANGKMNFEGTLSELIERQQSSALLNIAVSNAAEAVATCKRLNIPASIVNELIVLPALSRQETAGLNKALVHAGIDVYSISASNNDLESIFMQITNSPAQ